MPQTRSAEEPPFDPAATLFLAQAQRPAGLEAVSAPDLTPFQRALLVIDGTVTTFLEAWSLEPVAVRRLWQRPVPLAVANAWLDAPAGTPALERAVILAGARTGSLFAYAESLILPDRLPARVSRRLTEGMEGLGQILVAAGMDTRREGLWYGRERRTPLPAAVAAESDGDFLARTYRITAGGKPLMLITERFPWRPGPVTTAT